MTLVEECQPSDGSNKRHPLPRHRRRKKRFPTNAWFDGECKVQKRKVNISKKQFLQQPFNETVREQFFRERKVYKKLIPVKGQKAPGGDGSSQETSNLPK